MGNKTQALMQAARHFETGAFSALLSVRKTGRPHPYLFEAGERAPGSAQSAARGQALRASRRMMKLGMSALMAIAGISGAMTAAAAETVPLLPTSCEEALALSALPARLRAEATTYVLEADGFRKTREGTGPFTCLVTRNHPDSIIPLCFDQAGTKAIVPSEIRRGEMIQAGKTNDAFNAERTQGAKDGTVKVPAPGVSYMTSDYNYIYNAEAGQIVKVPAHMMYYAPT